MVWQGRTQHSTVLLLLTIALSCSLSALATGSSNIHDDQSTTTKITIGEGHLLEEFSNSSSSSSSHNSHKSHNTAASFASGTSLLDSDSVHHHQVKYRAPQQSHTKPQRSLYNAIVTAPPLSSLVCDQADEMKISVTFTIQEDEFEQFAKKSGYLASIKLQQHRTNQTNFVTRVLSYASFEELQPLDLCVPRVACYDAQVTHFLPSHVQIVQSEWMVEAIDSRVIRGIVLPLQGVGRGGSSSSGAIHVTKYELGTTCIPLCDPATEVLAELEFMTGESGPIEWWIQQEASPDEQFLDSKIFATCNHQGDGHCGYEDRYLYTERFCLPAPSVEDSSCFTLIMADESHSISTIATNSYALRLYPAPSEDGVMNELVLLPPKTPEDLPTPIWVIQEEGFRFVSIDFSTNLEDFDQSVKRCSRSISSCPLGASRMEIFVWRATPFSALPPMTLTIQPSVSARMLNGDRSPNLSYTEVWDSRQLQSQLHHSTTCVPISWELNCWEVTVASTSSANNEWGALQLLFEGLLYADGGYRLGKVDSLLDGVDPGDVVSADEDLRQYSVAVGYCQVEELCPQHEEMIAIRYRPRSFATAKLQQTFQWWIEGPQRTVYPINSETDEGDEGRSGSPSMSVLETSQRWFDDGLFSSQTRQSYFCLPIHLYTEDCLELKTIQTKVSNSTDHVLFVATIDSHDGSPRISTGATSSYTSGSSWYTRTTLAGSGSKCDHDGTRRKPRDYDYEEKKLSSAAIAVIINAIAIILASTILVCYFRCTGRLRAQEYVDDPTVNTYKMDDFDDLMVGDEGFDDDATGGNTDPVNSEAGHEEVNSEQDIESRGEQASQTQQASERQNEVDTTIGEAVDSYLCSQMPEPAAIEEATEKTAPVESAASSKSDESNSSEPVAALNQSDVEDSEGETNEDGQEESAGVFVEQTDDAGTHLSNKAAKREQPNSAADDQLSSQDMPRVTEYLAEALQSSEDEEKMPPDRILQDENENGQTCPADATSNCDSDQGSLNNEQLCLRESFTAGGGDNESIISAVRIDMDGELTQISSVDTAGQYVDETTADFESDDETGEEEEKQRVEVALNVTGPGDEIDEIDRVGES